MSSAVAHPSSDAGGGAQGDGSSDSRPLRQSSRNRVPSRRAEEMMQSSSAIEEQSHSTRKKAGNGAATKKAKKGKSGKDMDESVSEERDEDSDEGEDDDDDDDDQVYCICRKGDTGTPMVFCGQCEGWYHFKCVGLTKKAAESVLEFVCPPCNERTGRKSKVEGMDDDKEEEEDVASPASKRKRTDESSSTKRARRSLSPIETTVERQTSLASPSAALSPVEIPKARKASTSTFTAPSSSKSHSSSAINVSRSRSDALRKHAREQFASIFGEILSEADVADAQSRADEYNEEFESALFELTGEPLPRASFRVAGKAYRDKLRSFLFNLKDKSNAALRGRIADGTLPARDLSTLSSEELANDLIREEVERRRKENLEQSILKKEAAPLRKLTHKGEIDIEYENAQQRAAVVDNIEHVAKPAKEDKVDGDSSIGEAMSNDKEELGKAAVHSTPPAPRRVSQPVQSPTLPFDFTNVWQGSPQMDGSEHGDDEEVQEEQQEIDETTERGENSGEVDADNFIDNFLGMPEGEGEGQGKTTDTSITTDTVGAPAHSAAQQWKGSINMPDEGAFSCSVRQIGGRKLDDEEWDNLFPTEHSLIEGRLPSGSAIPYLLQSRVAIRTELVAFAAEVKWMPELMRSAFKVDSESSNEQTFHRMVQYFQKKDRYGVLQPKKTARGKHVKDFYISALPKDKPLPEWLTLLDSLQFSEHDRARQDMFVLVAVLFKTQPASLSVQKTVTPASSAVAAGTSRSPLNPGSTPPTNIASMLGPGSTTLQDLLRAVGGSRNPPGASPVQPTYSGVGMQSPTYDGSTPPSLPAMASAAYAPGQAVPASSVQALSQLPKTQLEDVLTKNPTLVDDLLKTLNKSSTGTLPPPGPPPMRPPTLAQQVQSQSAGQQQQQQQGYGQTYQNHGGGGTGNGVSHGYPSSGFPAQGYAQQPMHQHQQHGHGPGRNFVQRGRGGGASQYPYRGGGAGGGNNNNHNGRGRGRGQW